MFIVHCGATRGIYFNVLVSFCSFMNCCTRNNDLGSPWSIRSDLKGYSVLTAKAGFFSGSRFYCLFPRAVVTLCSTKHILLSPEFTKLSSRLCLQQETVPGLQVLAASTRAQLSPLMKNAPKCHPNLNQACLSFTLLPASCTEPVTFPEH